MVIKYGEPPVRIEGDGLVLREWELGDLAAMSELFDNPEVAYWTPLRSPFDLAAAQAYYDAAHTDNGRIHLAITTDGERPLGEVMMNSKTGALGYAVGPAYRGQGLAVRAVGLLTAYAHDVLGLPRDPGDRAGQRRELVGGATQRVQACGRAADHGDRQGPRAHPADLGAPRLGDGLTGGRGSRGRSAPAGSAARRSARG